MVGYNITTTITVQFQRTYYGCRFWQDISSVVRSVVTADSPDTDVICTASSGSATVNGVSVATANDIVAFD
uniref:GPS domain-containing protein n=1 Tax=Syphacia muris TaxID=451379 RepID=A0A0N5AN85_9BILA